MSLINSRVHPNDAGVFITLPHPQLTVCLKTPLQGAERYLTDVYHAVLTHPHPIAEDIAFRIIRKGSRAPQHPPLYGVKRFPPTWTVSYRHFPILVDFIERLLIHIPLNHQTAVTRLKQLYYVLPDVDDHVVIALRRVSHGI